MRTEPKLALCLDVDPRSPLVARREIQSFAAGLDEQTRSNLALLVSELVTNSLRHATFGPESWVRVEATIGADSVRVEVADPGERFPTAPDLGEEGGWGLILVDRVASRWGVARDEQTRVWFEADLPRPAGGDGWLEVVGAWPEACRKTARSVGRMLGPPHRVTETSLAWDRGDGCRLVIERTRSEPPSAGDGEGSAVSGVRPVRPRTAGTGASRGGGHSGAPTA
jgi:anti-sigma regulatory factor (Ser/Thr protein kinase)